MEHHGLESGQGPAPTFVNDRFLAGGMATALIMPLCARSDNEGDTQSRGLRYEKLYLRFRMTAIGHHPDMVAVETVAVFKLQPREYVREADLSRALQACLLASPSALSEQR